MTRINEIQAALKEIEGGRFQTLANQYLHRKYSLGNCVHVGSQFGTDKTTTGVPDMYSIEDGRFIFAAFTTSTSDIRSKLVKDAHDCLDEDKTKINSSLIKKIILCHTTPRLEPAITAEVMSVDPRIEIIGPETIADDLNVKYPTLAHLALGVPLGKGSFISPDTFVERSSQGRFTTSQSKPFKYRDNEMPTIVKAIEDNKVVVIQGQSGSGKTRIALEACREFSKAQHWDFLVLDSKYSSNLDEDIELIPAESENIIILVDDANSSVSLEHLLSVCASNDKLKLIFTCRKAHRSDLAKRIGARLKYEEIELMALAAEDINSLLETDYGIENQVFRERITSISNGNLRLAIMAALSATEGDCEAIREPYDLLKFYMDSALDEYSHRERRIAEIIAIYDNCDLVEGDPCYNSLLNLGYSKTEIRNFVSKLDEREIVTTITSPENVLALRMEEQNLRDFLICHHFAKANHGSYSDFILSTAEMADAPYIKAAKSMVEVCGSESVADYIRRECERAWPLLEGRTTPTRDRFMVAFNQFLPIQALIYAANCIESASETDVSEEIISRNVTSADSAVLSILVSLMELEEHSDAAIELFTQCVEKGGEKPSHYKWACGCSSAFSQHHNHGVFDLELKKLDAFVKKYKETKSPNIAACSLLLTDAYLSSRAEQIKQAGLTYTISTLRYNHSSELSRLHARCYRTLAVLIGSKFDARVKNTFRQHFSFYGEQPNPEHAKSMMAVLKEIEDLLPSFVGEDTTSNYSCCLCINWIYEARNQKPPVNLSLFSEETINALGCENAASLIEKRASIRPYELSFDQLTKVLTKLSEDCELSEKRWEASEAANNVLFEIAKRRPEDAVAIIVDFIVNGSKKCSIPCNAISHLASSIGRKNLYNEFSATLDADTYPGLFDYLDLLAIEEGPDEDDLRRMTLRLEDGRFHLSLEKLAQIEAKYPGYTVAYTTKYCKCIKDSSNAWRFFGNCYAESDIETLDHFIPNPAPIVELYFAALKGYSHFDYNLAFLRRLLLIDRSISGRFLDHASKLDYHFKHELLQRLSSLWIDPEESAWQLLKTFVDDALNKPLSRFDLTSLLPVHSNSAFGNNIFWRRFESLVAENATNEVNLGAISWAMSECDDQTRIRMLVLILTLDRDGQTIDHLSLRRSSMRGSAEEGFIPAKQREIEVLKSVMQQLPPSASYLRHKEWLSKEIRHIEADICNEKWDLFHGKR